MPSLLLEQIERHAAERPTAFAAVETGPDGDMNSITWRGFRNAVANFAHVLRSRLQPGSVVILIAPNCTRYLISFHACLAADLTVFPISMQTTNRDRRDAIRQSGAKACIADDEAVDSLSDLTIERIPLSSVPMIGTEERGAATSLMRSNGEGSLLLQSSGTTGMPRIVRRSMAALLAVGENCRKFVAMTPEDHLLAVIPISHSYGIDHAVLGAILAGATVHLSAGFNAMRVSDMLRTRQITIFPGVPFIFEALAQACVQPHRLPQLRQAFSAGSPLPMRVFDSFHGAFHTPIGQVYGSTEFGSITFNDPAIAPFDPLSVGRAMSGVNFQIVDRDHPQMNAPLPAGTEGQIAVAATSMFHSYLAQDASPMIDDWFLPADLGRLDEDGRLTITGRTKLLIDVGGLKVNPMEVESVLKEHPSVRDALVVPVSFSETIQRVKAMIVWRDVKGDMNELRCFAQQHLAPYKVPRIFEVRESFPRTATGKILRSALQST